jgi:hypothetical protein
MYFKYKKVTILLISILLLVFILPASKAENYEKSYTFQTQQNFQFQYGLFHQKLYISIPPSLSDYYGNISHRINSDSDYAKFVTPQAVKSIAENIQMVTRNLYNSDEQFANAVLAVVHQIQYNSTDPTYPVETLVKDSGNCVSLSLLTASIMLAGGLDVVLIQYSGIDPGHMNVGLYLPYTPAYHTFLMSPTDFIYNNKTYWTVETTSEADWKVGDQSDMLANAKVTIIPLNNTEISSPGQLTSSLNAPSRSSAITINLTQEPQNVQENMRVVTVSGSITPTYSAQNITVYANYYNESSYDYFQIVTDDLGMYTFTWNFTSEGTYHIRTSWSGNSNYSGADSETLTVFVGPESVVQYSFPESNYILEQANNTFNVFGEANNVAHRLSSMKGVNDFFSVPLKGNVSVSYNFTILQAGHSMLRVQTKKITLPASEQVMRLGRNRYVAIKIPAQTRTVLEVPPGMKPISLPDDFNQTINNQFCFILQNNFGNYSLNIRGLNDYDMSNISQSIGSNTAFMNTAEKITKNIWYKVTANISDTGITANLCDTNGTLIESMLTSYGSIKNNEIVMLIANNVDSAVVFKDLKVEALDSNSQLPKGNEKTTAYSELIFPYIGLLIILFITFVVVAHIKKRREKKLLPNASYS